MENSTILFLINDEARAIAVQYELGGKTSLAKTLDQTLKVDDYVVVETDTRWEMTVAKVKEVDLDINFETERNVKWIVQKVDHEGHEEVLKQEQAAIAAVQSAERRRKRDELRASLFADHQEKLKTLALSKTEDSTVTE